MDAVQPHAVTVIFKRASKNVMIKTMTTLTCVLRTAKMQPAVTASCTMEMKAAMTAT